MPKRESNGDLLINTQSSVLNEGRIDMETFVKSFKLIEKDYERAMPIKAIKDAIKGFSLLGYKVDRIITPDPMFIDVDTDMYPCYKKYADATLERLYLMVKCNMSLDVFIDKNKLWTHVYDTDVELVHFIDRYEENQITLKFYISEV